MMNKRFLRALHVPYENIIQFFFSRKKRFGGGECVTKIDLRIFKVFYNTHFFLISILTFNPVHSSMRSSCFECWSSGSLSVSCKVSVPLSFSPSSIVRNDAESVTSFCAIRYTGAGNVSSVVFVFCRNNEPNFSKKPPSMSWILN